MQVRWTSASSWKNGTSCVLEMAENKEEVNSCFFDNDNDGKTIMFFLFFLFLAVLDLKVSEQ